jgi:hypothetical protein
MEDMIFQFERSAHKGASRESSQQSNAGIEHRVDTQCDVCQLLDGDVGGQVGHLESFLFLECLTSAKTVRSPAIVATVCGLQVEGSVVTDAV